MPQEIKDRLLARADQRITRQGVIVIKAQTSRSQEMNRTEALARLQSLVDAAAVRPKHRRPTKPTRSSQQRRLDSKGVRARIKAGRGPVAD